VLSLLSQTTPQPDVPQVWEKPIAPGLVFREEVDRAAHQSLEALRISIKCPAIEVTPALAGTTTYKDATSTGRGPLSGMIASTNALAGVNGDFFSMESGPSGDPLGITVKDGQLLSTPSHRVAFGWGPDEAVMSVANFGGTVQSGSTILRLDAINRKCAKDQITLDTPAAGIALSTAPCVAAVLKFPAATWTPSTVLRGTVQSISADQPSLPIDPNSAVLVARGSKADILAQLKAGASVVVALKTTGFNWEHIDNVIGGGPILVKAGQIAVDAAQENFPPAFSEAKHPRTAIGRTANGDLWLVAVDGRQETGDGMTLAQLAQKMKDLGCTEAMNLDGGGSTTMNVLGVTVNRPSDGQERAIADGVLVLGHRAKSPVDNAKIETPTEIKVGQTIKATIHDERGNVPPIEIIWGCSGSCAIDQGGTIKALRPGTATLRAYADGQILTKTIQAVAPAND
jgi:exopolysaccharide biosynthesis protein